MKYDQDKLADIEGIVRNLGDEVSRTLIHFHAITGCDTTSYFFGFGKLIPFKRAVDREKMNLIAKIGEREIISPETMDDCKEFVRTRTVIYNGKPTKTYVETRIRFYDEQPNKKTTMMLPPDEDSCTQHLLRTHHRLDSFQVLCCSTFGSIHPWLETG